MSWKKELSELIQRHWRPGQNFSLKQVYDLEKQLLARHPGNNHVRAKIRQTLQYLRDDSEISFVDGNGTYLRLK